MALVILPPPHLNSHNPPNYPNNPPRHLGFNMGSQVNSRPSLPSISSLIESVADHNDSGAITSPRNYRDRRISSASQNPSRSPERPINPSPRSHAPPTPPLPLTSSFNFARCPDANTSPASAPTVSPFPQKRTSSTSPELYARRNSPYQPVPDRTLSYLPLPDAHPWPAPRSAPERPAHETRPAPHLASSELSDDGQHQGLQAQKSLPTDFPPPLQTHAAPLNNQQMSTTPTWQHHHYYPPANPPSYPQTQERYICLTCNKPFSRPSSLKIHTYSHTGEKPYKCKHEGCGKHFSVRSNMKRHEKGCHGGERPSPSSSGNLKLP